MLSGHTLAIAAIFVPYMGFMVVLGAYIYRTGQPPREEHQDRGDGEQEPDLLLAA